MLQTQLSWNDNPLAIRPVHKALHHLGSSPSKRQMVPGYRHYTSVFVRTTSRRSTRLPLTSNIASGDDTNASVNKPSHDDQRRRDGMFPHSFSTTVSSSKIISKNQKTSSLFSKTFSFIWKYVFTQQNLYRTDIVFSYWIRSYRIKEKISRP